MNTPLSSAATGIESLWRAYLGIYGEPHARNSLIQRWPNDPNVGTARIQFEYPPAFQPGYVGPAYFTNPGRLVFLGYNPGEGSQAALRPGDQLLGDWLQRFARGDETLLTLSQFQASHIIKWPIYRGKGIFRETDDDAIALLPAPVRPSVQSVALLNLFPFKTVKNSKPLAGWGGPETSLKAHMWDRFVRPTLELLAPNVIVHYPDADSYAQSLSALPSKPTLVRAWHPSDYNLNAQRNGLAQSWQPLARALAASPRCVG